MKPRKIETLEQNQIGKPEKEHQDSNVNLEEAEKIVNDYGLAMMAVSDMHRKRVKGLLQDPSSFQGKEYGLFPIRAKKENLPHPKDTIRAALELLLSYDDDPNNRALLKAGLEYLEYFV